MPSKHSKNAGDRGHYTYQEKKQSGVGSISQRIGSDSQLPFGHCPLSLNRIKEAVVSPSGRIYEREAILEYLLTKTKELKDLRVQYEKQLEQERTKEYKQQYEQQQNDLDKFSKTQDGVNICHRNLTVDEQQKSALASRKRLIDDTSREEQLAKLQQVSPWIPQFTPSAKQSSLVEPPKRPTSPFSKQPLRSKDLIPVILTSESSSSSSSSSSNAKFICCVSRKTITNQKVVLIKNTGVILLESIAQQLAYPSMICPVTGKSFKKEDIIEIVPATSGFAASGSVEVKKYRPSFN